ncbi:hypothetical protein ABZ671_27405 [Micromonospora sp. NPDC006766]|uniref:hypothetical protein n=1 Tax=Micromonospora sp. NPDC006766 TaxID=3154778 RepID=UPI003409BF2D
MGRIWLRCLAGVAAGGLLLALNACNDSDNPRAHGGDNQGADGASEDARLTVTFDVTGGTTIKGTVTDAVPSNSLSPSCAEYAAGTQSDGKTVFSVPSLVMAGPVDGHEVTIEAVVYDYNGPGTYPGDKLSGLGNPGNLMIDKQQQYEILTGVTTSQLVVDSKGGGSWTFTNLNARGDTPKPGLNGKISWTCR